MWAFTKFIMIKLYQSKVFGNFQIGAVPDILFVENYPRFSSN